MCVFDVLPATVGHFVCKIADTQLVYDFFSAEPRTKPCARYFLSFFQHTSTCIYARVGNLQPFARIHKSWTVLVCNVVLGLNVEFRSMSSVDGDYKLTHTHTHTWQLVYVILFLVNMKYYKNLSRDILTRYL